MTVSQLADILDAKIAVLADGELSNVMGKAPADSAWFTVMSNVNVCAVATLTDCAAVVLCESTEPDAALTERAGQNDVNLLITSLPVFEAAVKVAGHLG